MARYRLSSPWAGDPWGSFDELRRSMNELFERASPMTVRRGGVFPPVNLYEVADAYVLTAELPGLTADDISVSLERNAVTLGGERKVERPADASLHRAERQGGSFRRTIELPVEIDPEKTEATYQNGLLVLRLPKAAEHAPRRVNVKTR